MVSAAQLVARPSRTSNRNSEGCGFDPRLRSVFHSSRVTARGKLSAVAGHHSFFRAVRIWSLRLSALTCRRLVALADIGAYRTTLLALFSERRCNAFMYRARQNVVFEAHHWDAWQTPPHKVCAEKDWMNDWISSSLMFVEPRPSRMVDTASSHWGETSYCHNSCCPQYVRSQAARTLLLHMSTRDMI